MDCRQSGKVEVTEHVFCGRAETARGVTGQRSHLRVPPAPRSLHNASLSPNRPFADKATPPGNEVQLACQQAGLGAPQSTRTGLGLTLPPQDSHLCSFRVGYSDEDFLLRGCDGG